MLPKLHGLAWVVVVCAVLTGCGKSDTGTPEPVIAGTSLIADIVTDLTGESVAPFTLLPSHSCPSQFDMKAGDIGRLQKARVVLLHPWQLQLANIRRVVEAARLPDDRIVMVDVQGNWMLPDVQAQATDAVATILTALFPEKQADVAHRAAERLERIRAAERQARALLPVDAAATQVVLCNEMQAPFVRWVGFDVAEAYGRPESWSVAETERLVRMGGDKGVALLIDNLQSGGMRMSATLARDIGAVNVVLSNFPNGFPGTPDWESAFLENIRRLKETLLRAETP